MIAAKHNPLWTRRQSELRRLISAAGCFDEALALFQLQHAPTHTARVYGGGGWSLQDEVLAGLSEAHFRICPAPEGNSAAWLIWHITRIEDMTINCLVFAQPQVLDRAGWPARLGLDLRDCGSGMDAAGVQELSASISIPALLEYRAEVGRAVRAGLPGLSAACLKEKAPNSAVAALAADGSIGPQAPWLVEFYMNRPRSFFLTRTATSHNFLHLNQVGRLRDRLAGG